VEAVAAPQIPTVDADLAARLAAIVGAGRVLVNRSELFTYTSDGLPGYRKQPSIAVFPGTRDELTAVVRALAAAGAPFVARGAGTGLSGGALAEGVVLLGLHRLTRILRIDAENARAVVEPGVVNASISRAAAPFGLHFAPDPSSQAACTIGGNVAENAGGPHCLKYGVTLNHVLALTVILPSGEIVRLGNAEGESDGYDLLGTFVGSEGCFGVVLDASVRLMTNAPSVRTLLADFTDIQAAARAVSGVIATGIVPAALEMMDNPTIRAVEASIYAAGYPVDAAAVLLIELDGLEAGLVAAVARVVEICRSCGARDVRVAREAGERARLWQGRKKAFGAMGRIAPHLVVQDAVVPRTRLPDVLQRIQEIAARHRVMVCNVFHAGDGNLHPNIPYDASNANEAERVELAMGEIMRACIDAGGTITGEHGVGLDKLGYMDLVFSGDSLATMCRLRDVFDPDRRANPGKVVPTPSCREWKSAPRRAFSEAGVDAPSRRAPEDTGLAPRQAAPPVHAGTAAIRDAIASARAAREGVRLVGAGTWLGAGRPTATTRTVSLAGDDVVVDYVPGDLTITARAGITLAALNAITRAEGQCTALDPFGGDSGTLGATLATASYGPLAHAFGTPRDNVLGVELVTGEGAVARGGGRVVKNVAGFDLTRLAIGAWGTLAVITEATLRLRAIPETDITIALALPRDARALEAALTRIRSLSLAAWSLEALNGAAANAIGAGNAALLLARLAGNEPLVAAQRAAIAAIGDTALLDGDVWPRLRHAEKSSAAVVRLSCLPASLPRVVSPLLVDGGLPMQGTASVTLSRGVARIAVPPAALGALPPVLGGTPDVGGVRLTRVWEVLPAERWLDLAPSVALDALSCRVRDAFDPDRLLNRGLMGIEA
jgi:glycolate oxidase subunit GlcD